MEKVWQTLTLVPPVIVFLPWKCAVNGGKQAIIIFYTQNPDICPINDPSLPVFIYPLHLSSLGFTEICLTGTGFELSCWVKVWDKSWWDRFSRNLAWSVFHIIQKCVCVWYAVVDIYTHMCVWVCAYACNYRYIHLKSCIWKWQCQEIAWHRARLPYTNRSWFNELSYKLC